MSEVVVFPRRVRRRRPSLDEALLFEIAHTLRTFGGEAHRDLVVSDVARRAGFDARRPPPDLREDLMDAFERGCDRGGLGCARLFELPFGPGSHRWRLTPEAAAAELADPRFSDAG